MRTTTEKDKQINQRILFGILFRIRSGASSSKRQLEQTLKKVNGRVPWGAAMESEGTVFFPIIKNGIKSEPRESRSECDQVFDQVNDENISMKLNEIAEGISLLRKGEAFLPNVVSVQAHTLDMRMQSIGKSFTVE